MRALKKNHTYLGDAEALFEQLDDESVTLIYTDPPYRRSLFECYRILSRCSARVLKHGGSLATIMPTFNMPEFFETFKYSELKWRWELNMSQTRGAHPRMAMGIEIIHKPIAWYVKGAWPVGRGFLVDQVDIEPVDKKAAGHKWAQDITWGLYYIRKLAPQGGLVLDPFFGAGTVGAICQALNLSTNEYHWDYLGFDNDPEAVKTAQKRLHERKRSA